MCTMCDIFQSDKEVFVVIDSGERSVLFVNADQTRKVRVKLLREGRGFKFHVESKGFDGGLDKSQVDQVIKKAFAALCDQLLLSPLASVSFPLLG